MNALTAQMPMALRHREPVVAASRLPHLCSMADVRCAIDQDSHRPGATLALSSQPAARFEQHKQRRPHPETFSEEQS